jgi:hypothetical protein
MLFSALLLIFNDRYYFSNCSSLHNESMFKLVSDFDRRMIVLFLSFSFKISLISQKIKIYDLNSFLKNLCLAEFTLASRFTIHTSIKIDLLYGRIQKPCPSDWLGKWGIPSIRERQLSQLGYYLKMNPYQQKNRGRSKETYWFFTGRSCCFS